jgi:beta-lactamase regulating signal transducer with metallopeptidase domain
MQQLMESVFLQALGKTIAASIWQSAILYLLYQLVIKIFKVEEASQRNFLSTLLVFVSLSWFTISFLLNLQTTYPASVINVPGNEMMQSSGSNKKWQLVLHYLLFQLNYLLPYLGVAYLFVLFGLSLKMMIQLHQTNILRRNGIIPVQEELRELIQMLALSIGVGKKVTAYISEHLDIPATVGYLKPIILLPAATVTHLTPAQLEAVLLHELAHIRRNDYFWNLMLSIAEIVLFFNPFVLLLIHQARKERENSCDDVVMHYQQNASVYAEALLTVEKSRIFTPRLVMALGNNKHQLMYRIKRILNMPVEKNKMSLRLLALLFFTMLFAVTGSFLNKKETKEKNTSKKLNQPYLINRSIIFSSKEVLADQKDFSLRLKENGKKLNAETIKQENQNVLIAMNKEESSEMLERMVIEDAPKEWSFKTEDLPAEHYFLHLKEDLFKKQFHSDAYVYFNEQKEKAAEVWKQFYENRSTTPFGGNRIPKNPMNFYFNGDWGTDSIHLLRELPLSELFAEKGYELLTEVYKRELPKLERNKKQMELFQQRMERAKELQLRIRSKKINNKAEPAFIFFEQEPFGLVTQRELSFNDEQQHKKQFTIVIEQNEDRLILSEQIRKDSTQKQPVQQKRKVLEIIQL